MCAPAGGIPTKTGIAYEAARTLMQDVARSASEQQERQVAQEGLLVLEGRGTVPQ
jgi:hypothetical protein